MPWWAGSADLVPSGNADDQNGGWAKPTGPAFGRPDDRLRVPTAAILVWRWARFALPTLRANLIRIQRRKSMKKRFSFALAITVATTVLSSPPRAGADDLL